MVSIRFERNDEEKTVALNINGHAGFDSSGKDIVCSAVSILAYTLAEYLSIVYGLDLIKTPTLIMNDGNVRIKCQTDTNTVYQHLIDKFTFVQLGFELIKNTYPEYLKLTAFGNPSGD